MTVLVPQMLLFTLGPRQGVTRAKFDDDPAAFRLYFKEILRFLTATASLLLWSLRIYICSFYPQRPPAISLPLPLFLPAPPDGDAGRFGQLQTQISRRYMTLSNNRLLPVPLRFYTAAHQKQTKVERC